jgi:hypothetical protein
MPGFGGLFFEGRNPAPADHQGMSRGLLSDAERGAVLGKTYVLV